jgi:hypothetical protein
MSKALRSFGFIHFLQKALKISAFCFLRREGLISLIP